MKPFFVYMLRCRDGSFYVGHTDDLEARMIQHGEGTLGGYTARRRPVALVWHEEMTSRGEALEAEVRIKGWSRAKKEALIRGDWPELKRLARGRDRLGPLDSACPERSRERGGVEGLGANGVEGGALGARSARERR